MEANNFLAYRACLSSLTSEQLSELKAAIATERARREMLETQRIAEHLEREGILSLSKLEAFMRSQSFKKAG